MTSSPSSFGRDAALARRRAQATGKSGMPPSADRSRAAPPALRSDLQNSAPPAAPAVEAVADAKGAAPASQAVPLSPLPMSAALTARAAARERRRTQSLHGRSDEPAARPGRLPRRGAIDYAPKVVASETPAGVRVTGLRIGRGRQVTGSEAGSTLPVSGTPYVGVESAVAQRPAAPKVGFARTPGGRVVSGTQVRSRVAVTGDEPAPTAIVTGESDQRPEDDLTARDHLDIATSSQFMRQVDPHGHSVFGTNLGRSAATVGSRQRQRANDIESTERGLAITGSAVGRSARVTGDESGACRRVTGDQYLTPGERQAECGGRGGATAPAALTGFARSDPVSGAKVTVASTWSRQRVTGADVEHRPGVTGDEPGSCRVITGTPYQGPHTIEAWCDAPAADAAAQRLPRAAALAAVTGDVPGIGRRVTGNLRGAERQLTGTSYAGAGEADPAAAPGVAAVDEGFSVSSPQRAAQLRRLAAIAEAKAEAGAGGATAADAAGAVPITGSFALGEGRITGNFEFRPLERRPSRATGAPAHARVTGEGRSSGRAITGDAWRHSAAVTGTEGAFASERNPSERGGDPHGFAGAARFKSLAKREDRRQLVTGMVGGSAKPAAPVTLSGGAQG